MRFNLLCLAVVLGLNSHVFAADTPASAAAPATTESTYVIDDYSLEWTAFSQGESKLAIVKTQETTLASISQMNGFMYNSLKMLPADAVEIGKVLNQTKDIHAKLKGKVGERQEVKTKKHVVTFAMQENGFVVVIKEQSLKIEGIVFDVKEANAFAAPLQEAGKMAEFLNKKVTL